MNILFITKHDPFGIGGGSFASHAYLRAFSEITNGQIDICLAEHCVVSDDAIRYRNIYRVKKRSIINRCFSLFTGELHRYTTFVEKLLTKQQQYDYCVFDHNSISGTLVKFVNKLNINTITIHHNYEPDYFISSTSNLLIKALLLPIVKRIERTAYRHSNFNFFLTQVDLDTFARQYGKVKAVNSVTGCFEYTGTVINLPANPIERRNISLVISCSLSNNQNRLTLQNFFKNYYSLLPQESKIIIAGKDPSKKIRQLCAHYPNVLLIPNPIDMNEVIRLANIYLCPIEIGGGLKLRIMDGLKNALPILAHKNAARGYDTFLDREWFQVYKDENDFIIAFNNLTQLVKHKKGITSNIIRNYMDSFSLDAGKQRIREAIQCKK
jgi:glycosyltransferase involved in cell wall biosynthesis